MGKLFIANPSNTSVDYLVNGGAIQAGRPFSPGPTPPRYTPYFVFAGIGRYVEPRTIGYGENTVSATFRDEGARQPSYKFTFTFPTNYSVQDNLVADVLRGLMILTTSAGMPLSPNPLVIVGSPPPPPPPVNQQP